MKTLGEGNTILYENTFAAPTFNLLPRQVLHAESFGTRPPVPKKI
ncbi:hypothetical protein [Algoriphagus aquimarinus]